MYVITVNVICYCIQQTIVIFFSQPSESETISKRQQTLKASDGRIPWS